MAMILKTSFPFNPEEFREKYKGYMSEDILQRLRAAHQNPESQLTSNVYYEAFVSIGDKYLTTAN